MKLMRHGPRGAERPGLIDAQGMLRDLSGHCADFSGAGVSCAALGALRQIAVDALPVLPAETRIGSCLGWVPNFLCIGRNYAAHAAETGAAVPEEPMVFSKATSALAGPFDPLYLPPGADHVDWEVELGVVIGAPLSRASEAEAMAAVAGYCVVNDFSERHYQKERGGQFIKGKSLPGFGPVGPWLVTADAVADPQALALELSVNGAVQQSARTADMLFGVAHLLSYLSHFMDLQPGDLLATGTPEGVGLGQVPPRFLRPGDLVEASIAGLGTQRTEICQ